ncbi:hypothetical protein BC351_12820 [Paenibacillus ferrarius]|uniref:FAD:protein FMN transferase n=1 Tax=Paenibacillus ferrarius TaxID=1469647 RepID=A0A1V4H7C8_9BACL|nr:FAD:protein FMN transferase [Paenibacillus ferrarius]OPH46817.1 hypothetical protein BC351_12820 [Paenibacillus ferrarius]
MLKEISFRAMNTQIQLLLASNYEMTDLASSAKTYFTLAEARFSRFLPYSECSLLNKRAGSRCLISEEMAAILALSQHYFELTEGVFHIAILPALERAGYDRTFELLDHVDRLLEGSGPARPLSQNEELHMDLDINMQMQSVQMKANQTIDLGGIAKSWAVRGLSDVLRRERQVQRGLVNAGGDVEVWGGASEEEPWVVAIANPHPVELDREVMLLLMNGAVATSSTQRRSWQTNEGNMHHLIDPRTMKPSKSSVIQCSVVGANLVDCEIWAKVICILGIQEGIALFRRKTERLEALIYTNDGAVHYVKSEAKWVNGQWVGLQPDYVYDSNEKGGSGNDSNPG